MRGAFGYRWNLKNDSLRLDEREWVCPECGQVHDRDVHAAEMIHRRGIYDVGE